MENIIKTYVLEDGIAEWALPEFYVLNKKYPSKYDSIIEIMKNMYFARTLVGKGDISIYMNKIRNLTNAIKINIEEFGMSKQEFDYISKINSTFLGGI